MNVGVVFAHTHCVYVVVCSLSDNSVRYASEQASGAGRRMHPSAGSGYQRMLSLFK
jgi:hypothetical protein